MIKKLTDSCFGDDKSGVTGGELKLVLKLNLK